MEASRAETDAIDSAGAFAHFDRLREQVVAAEAEADAFVELSNRDDEPEEAECERRSEAIEIEAALKVLKQAKTT
jgi:hypothetical protein